MPGLFGATASTYHPTLRDRAAIGLLGLLGNPNPNSATGHLVGGLLGSYGAGSTGQMSLADFLPFFQADEAGRQMASGHPLFGAANLAMALPLPVAKGAQMAKGLFGGAGRKAVEDAAQAAERAAPIIAYHGSPHQFDKFDAAKIGTGEGAQAYGHGLYFAENPDVAQGYRDRLGTPPPSSSPENIAQRVLDAVNGDRDAAIDQLNARARAWLARDANSRTEDGWDNIMGAIQAVRSQKPLGAGHVYQVGINAHPDHFLDWDKPLSEQHPKVKEALSKVDTKLNGSNWTPADHIGAVDAGYEHIVNDPKINLDGSSLYQALGGMRAMGRADDGSAAQALQQAGIPGIKYLDAGSRSAGDGTRNYVVFNPDHVDILKRYGIPATVFGGAGAAAAANQGASEKPDTAPVAPDDVVPAPESFRRGGAVNHAPTEAQKAAGNYKKAHISFQGLPISIENLKGSTRSGTDERGKPWSCTLPADYGYIKGTEGADGDHVDVYVGPDPHSKTAFIVNQRDHRTHRFDEHKIVLGVHSEREAADLYCRAFSDGKGRQRLGSIETVSIDALKAWLRTRATLNRADARSIIDRALKITAKGHAHV